MKLSTCTLLLLPLALLLACDDGDSEDAPITGDKVAGGGPPLFSLYITDAPVERVDRVLLTFIGIEFKPRGAEPIAIVFDQPVQLDLLALQSGLRRALLEDRALPAGSYDWMRLAVDESRLFVEVDGLQLPLNMASLPDPWLLDLDVLLQRGDSLDLTLDLDLRQSLRRSEINDYFLRPVLRLVNTAESGELTGRIDSQLLAREDCQSVTMAPGRGAVYLFPAAQAELQDIRGDAGDPLATAGVTDEGSFQFSFLSPGSYQAVFTCDAELDEPDQVDLQLDFARPVRIDIVSGGSSRVVIR